MTYFISKYKNTALVALAILSLSSCLKDEGAENGSYGLSGFAGGEFISLPLAANNPNALALESKTGNQTLTLFQANYEYVDKAPEDIVVTFTPDAAAVAAVAGLTALPAGTIIYPSGSPSITIAKGTRVSPAFTCQINTGSLDPTKAYGVAFTISSVSKSSAAIPKNLKTIVYKLSLKNKYDGIYKVTGPMTDAASAALTQYMPSWTAHLETTGPASVAVRDMTATGGIFHPIMNNGGASYYGSFGMIVTFNTITDIAVDMVSPYEPAPNTRTARLDPGFTSKWDPNSRNIRIKYHMFQPSAGFSTSPRVIFDETWTYLGPRK